MFGMHRSLHQTQRIYYVTISTMKPQCEKTTLQQTTPTPGEKSGLKTIQSDRTFNIAG